MSTKTPGQRTGLSITPRNILASTQGAVYLPGPVVIDATYAIDGSNTSRTDELRAGCLMARITNGLWVPLKRTRVASGTSGSGSGQTSTTLTVDNAAFFKADDTVTVTVAAGTVNRTISSINYTTNVLTLDSAVDNPSIGGAVIARGSLAGAETCRGILAETVRLLTTEPYNTTQYDTQAPILVAGFVKNAQLLGDLAAVRAAMTSHYLQQFLFDDEQGLS